MADKNGVKVIIGFMERGQGKNVAKVFLENQLPVSFQCPGMGTASSELLDVLGLGTAERDIIFSIASTANAERMMHMLDEDFSGHLDAHGIIIDLPLTGINNMIATALMNMSPENMVNGGEMMDQHTDNSMILVTVNQGHTDEVMDTARGAGARGGTIIRARWSGSKDSEQFYGMNIQEEKEIIFIVTTKENRNAIMETINMKHGLNTEAGAMICSLGIDHIVRG